VLNRTGRIRLSACAACGELVRCQRCGGALQSRSAEAGADAGLQCGRCGLERPKVCAQCGGTRLKALRVGVGRAREEIEVLAGVPVAEVSAASAAGPEPIGAGPDPDSASVVIGTEAVLHRLGRADVVAFLDFDAELLAPRYGAGEQAMSLLAKAARLVGPRATDAEDRRRVLVQTRQPGHPAVLAAVGADPALLAGAERDVRGALGLPPYGAMALLSGPAAEGYGAALRAVAPDGVEVGGPHDGAWSVRAGDHAALCDLLAATARPPGRLRVEVDPLRA